jgi:hypothetical protein
MVLGPILLIIAFVRIARRNEANLPDDDHDDWDADLGDLPAADADLPPDARLPADSHLPADAHQPAPDAERQVCQAHAVRRPGLRPRSR